MFILYFTTDECNWYHCQTWLGFFGMFPNFQYEACWLVPGTWSED